MKGLVLLVVLLVIPGLVLATEPASTAKKLQTDIVNTPAIQTPDVKTLANYWSLDVIEYQQYQTLMRGPLGFWNPAIDPLLALGMFAESPAQQRRYAELYARQEFELTERALRFQQVYRAAFQRLYPNVDTVDQRLLAPYQLHQQQKATAKTARLLAKKQFQSGDRVMVFVPTPCKHCSSSIPRLMSLVSGTRHVGVDVYIRKAVTDADVRAWAQAHQISAKQLKGNALTLNRNEGLLQRLQSRSSIKATAGMPIYLKRNGQFFQLPAEDLGL